MSKMPDHEGIKRAALRAISPIRPADEKSEADEKFLFNAQRTNAGRALPPYYLVYFLLVDLLGFRNLGRFEKLAWSVPIDFNGKAYLIEHRKFGVGVFAHDAASEEDNAAQIVKLIQKGVKAAEQFPSPAPSQSLADLVCGALCLCDCVWLRHFAFFVIPSLHAGG